ncbi:MAG: DUF4159 domain-containing protein [Alphaproteobacteria bacterium]|nr:DUF4159 domain-containing protein [Alphaproteobacteria bacterium]
MLSFGPLAFTAPWMLLGVVILPVLWLLLRLMPPSPRRIQFPAIRLLFGLKGEETTPRAAPWWITLLRLSIAALVIATAARPVLNPDWNLEGEGPVILVMDDGWAAAPEWQHRLDRAAALLQTAERASRPVHLILGAPPADGNPLEAHRLLSAQAAQEVIAALTPKPWPVDRLAMTNAVQALQAEGVRGDVFWFSNGLETQDTADFSKSLSVLGRMTVLTPDLSLGPMVLDPPARGDSTLTVTVRRPAAEAAANVAVLAYADDDRPLFRQEAGFEAGETETQATLTLPIELRNSIARLSIEDRPGAGATAVLDERWSRRPIGIIADIGNREALPLLSEVYFLDRALRPLGTIDRGPLGVLLKVPQSVLLLPDETVLESDDSAALESWIQGGGMLIRFAGQRLAAAVDDPLVPVKLRSGGRQLSGAMAWSEPAHIGRVNPEGPLAGISIPKDVTISRQVLAEPSLDLDAKTWLRLADDTPLVTAEKRGQGWLVLVHTTANTDWSNMALSGLFVSMLERLSSLGQGVHDAASDRGLAPPYRMLDGFGRLTDPPNSARPLDVGTLESLQVSAATPPGFYGSQAIRVAVNLGSHITQLAPLTDLPQGTMRLGFEKEEEQALAPYLLLAALLLVFVDTLVTMVLRGFGGMPKRGGAAAAGLVLAMLVIGAPHPAPAQTVPTGALSTTLAYVITGDAEVDRVSAAGLRGLTEILRQRTAIEAGDPVGVDINRDELAFYPLLYWPISDDQPGITAPTADRINRFMATGGMILFDTRNGQLGGGGLTVSSDMLRRLARQLNIPQIAAVSPDHVLTRSFYLLQDFPGRWNGGTVWVETGASSSNDGVSPVVVGDADWASAWAIDESGRPMFAIGGEDDRRREMAYRFGVNLVMYTLTGNYKADQVHIPSILERLGQ